MRSHKIKPIVPENATDTPVSIAVIIISRVFFLLVLTPIDIACSSPKVIRSISRALSHMRIVITRHTGAIIRTWVQFLEEKEPIIQKYIRLDLSGKSEASKVRNALTKSEMTIPIRMIV